MFKLIANELFKLFHKKSTYIVLIIAFLYIILVNVLYNQGLSDTYSGSSFNTYYLEQAREDLAALKATNSPLEDTWQVELSIKVYEMLQNYHEPWQEEAINDDYYSLLAQYYNNLLDNEDVTAIENEITLMENRIKNNEWQYFLKNDLADEEARYEEYLKTPAKNDNEKQKLEKETEESAARIKIYNYALDNNIALDSSYLGQALNDVLSSLDLVFNYKYFMADEEKENSADMIEEFYENVYILENKLDTNNTRTLRNVFINLYDEIEIIVFVFIVMIAGSIISEEFNKGTIKNLLTIPYSRIKILSAKFIVCLLMILFIFIFAFLSELIVGGLIFGFSSLSIPMVHYLIKSGTYTFISPIAYFGLYSLCKLPMLILLMTLAFNLSTMLLNTAFAITITFFGYIGSALVNILAQTFKWKFLNYFVTTNWDFTVYLFHGTNPFGISMTQSVIVCLVYLFIMLLVSFWIFKKKNIKNI